jgi:hypothetical protein
MPQALNDQRIAEFLLLVSRLIDCVVLCVPPATDETQVAHHTVLLRVLLQ